MVIYCVLKIFPKMFICVGIRYISGIVILFNIFISTTVRPLGMPPGPYFHIIKTGKLKGMALVIYSNQFYLQNILNVLFIIFQSLVFIKYILVILILYKSRQLFIKGIFILFFWLSMIQPISFYKFGKDLIIYIKILMVLLSLYIIILFSVFIFKLGILFTVKVVITINNPLFRHLIQPVFF